MNIYLCGVPNKPCSGFYGSIRRVYNNLLDGDGPEKYLWPVTDDMMPADGMVRRMIMILQMGWSDGWNDATNGNGPTEDNDFADGMVWRMKWCYGW